MFLSQHIYHAVLNYGRMPAGNILEIGAFEGEGTRQLALRWPQRTIHVIDPFIEDGHTRDSTQRVQGEPITQQRQAYLTHTQALPNVITHEQTSREFDQSHPDLSGFDITCVIIDGSHHYEDVSQDTGLALRCLAGRSGVIVFDDLRIPDVWQAYQEFHQQHAGCILATINIADVAALLEIRQ